MSVEQYIAVIAAIAVAQSFPSVISPNASLYPVSSSFVCTSKVIFNVSALNKQNIDEFLNFELKTLKFKNTLYKEDIERIKFIEKSLNEKELVNS